MKPISLLFPAGRFGPSPAAPGTRGLDRFGPAILFRNRAVFVRALGRRLIYFALLAGGLAGSAGPLLRAAPSSLRTILADSIQPVPVDAPASGPHRVRADLSGAEAAAPLNFLVSLRMRHFAEFTAIVQSGQQISKADMEAKYLPKQSDYDRVCAWLTGQGFTLTLADQQHTNVFARGSVAQLAAALEVSFARIATPDGEYTSAVTPPSVPAELADVVLGVDGLQPHIQVLAPAPSAAAVADTFLHPSRVIPADLLTAYRVPANLNGAGQTIAIFANSLPLASDLASFYSQAGITELNPNFTIVPINGGALPGPPTGEVALDTEWSTGIAPGANLRVYACPGGGEPDFIAACTVILNEGIAKVFSSSISNPETSLAPATLQSCSQVLAQMAAAGISVFHGSGDSGAYGSPEYPTTDPYVTALSGTQMTFNANWTETGETVDPSTGGGYSTFFARPAWQTGPGVPAGTMRCVPDAAAPSSLISAVGTIFGLAVENGQTLGIGGTSATGPIWAGLAAIINQARANAGLPPVGLFGPRIYPLIGTNAFTDITVGNNGAYNAGFGYDLCSGVGTPLVANLIQALLAEPTILIQPQSQTIAPGTTVAFNVSAAATLAPTYQWQFNGGTIANATSPRLVLNGANAANAGTYTCTVANALLSLTTQPATLVAAATGNPGRLGNLSVLAQAGTGSQPLTVGFVTGGAGTSGAQTLLIRADGPALGQAPFDLPNVLADPQIILFQSESIVAMNDNWNSNYAQVVAADAATGAFPLPAGSLDSAMVSTLAAGAYSVQITGNGKGAGTALAEIYDDTAAGTYTPATPRLVNLSCLDPVAAGGVLTAGFVVGGTTSKTVLVRATGPALAATPFNLAGTMPDPELSVHASVGGQDTVLATNAGWGGDAQITAADAATGAFALTNPGSQDSAVLLSLPPGSYTAQVSSVSGVAGTTLVEVYEVP